MFGGSLFLFPHPVKELASFMHDNNIYINYDGAHVAGLIAGGEFQDPIREGSDSMTMSSHKTLWGPQGGIIVSLERYADLSLIHISEPTRQAEISYAVFCLKK